MSAAMTPLVSILSSSGGATVAVSAVGGVFYKLLKGIARKETDAVVKAAVSELKSEMNTRFDKADDTKKEIAGKQEQMALELAKQFGGNGGGMREAINRVEVGLA